MPDRVLRGGGGPFKLSLASASGSKCVLTSQTIYTFSAIKKKRKNSIKINMLPVSLVFMLGLSLSFNVKFGNAVSGQPCRIQKKKARGYLMGASRGRKGEESQKVC